MLLENLLNEAVVALSASVVDAALGGSALAHHVLARKVERKRELERADRQCVEKS
jgi:hypothetical protein